MTSSGLLLHYVIVCCLECAVVLTLFCSSSASANSLRMLASDSPTYLLRISGPLTTLGSRALSIFPICLAIRVLPQPGGPNRRMPFTCLQPAAHKTYHQLTQSSSVFIRGIIITHFEKTLDTFYVQSKIVVFN